ncbi:hypothetical protein HF086_007249, partial [Spodoptera exigua]
QDLRSLLKSKHVQGLEIYDAHKSLNRTKVLETVEAARTAISSSGGGPLFLALPAHPELLAKYYDLRTLVKKVDLLMVQTHALGLVKKMTYHPSRLSGMWDMMNTDSVVDLVIGLGVPSSKIVISLPATALQFTLVNETLSTPGSPTEDDKPKEIDQAELCRQLRSGRWTLERDQDLSAPYAFKNKTWISFEDSSSIDVKGKYARVRGLAGLALQQAERDVESACGPTLRASLAKVLNQQSRAPRAAVLRSLEHEILSAPSHVRALDALQVSPYRITQVDTRTEFSCSRQGYFVHPRSCARFYRCVKFDQLSPEYTVTFDNRYEVCVWPGSLPHSQACPGSSEIAPVPKTRFICPEHEGYYADPENCRWFFACLDHGKSPLTAYEFRCPFGLGFDAERLKCDWPWLVPACGNIARYEAETYGFSAATLTGAAGYQGQTADAINVAAHQSLVSGASLNNHVGIQGGFLTSEDALDSNFIASQELANAGHSYEIGDGSGHAGNGLAYQVGAAGSIHAGAGLVQPTQYREQQQYSSGSIILDDYRLPTKEEAQRQAAHKINIVQSTNSGNVHQQSGQTSGYSTQSGHTNGYVSHGAGQDAGYIVQAGGNAAQYNGYTGSYATGDSQKYQSSSYDDDNSGAYVHDPSGDYAEPYKHVGSPVEPYVHQDAAYKQSGYDYDYGKYSGSSQSSFEGKYTEDNAGKYVQDNSGAYVEANIGSNGYKGTYSTGYSTGYSADNSGAYKHDNSGQYEAGVYRADGHIGEGKATSHSNFQQYHGYSEANAGNYISDSKAYTGSSHTLTAGAINVGLVGKTTLIDADYNDQVNYYETDSKATGQGSYQGSKSYSHSTQTLHPAHVSFVSQPAVAINHVGTDGNNLDGYSYVTTPTSSGVPTTATPFAVTTSIPTVTYKTTFVPEAPKTSVKQIFGVSQPSVTYVQKSKDYSGSYNGETKVESGYEYSKPSIKFEDGISYTTAAPAISVSTYQPESVSHNQQTVHNVESVGFGYSTPTPVYEEPFKKVVAYTTGPSVSTYSQPTAATYTPHSFSHQTIHKVETSKVYTPSVESASVDTGYDYSKSGVTFEEPKVVQYTTAQPALAVQPIVSTYEPQVVSHQTLHKVDANRVNTYSGESSSGVSGYTYEQPSVQFEEGKNVYSTPAPIVSSTYSPKVFSHQTIHKDIKQYVPVSTTPKYEVSYQSTPVTVYENPIIKYTQKATPVTFIEPTYKSQSFSHQTIHKVEDNKSYNVESGYEYSKPAVAVNDQVHYTTVKPSVSTYQPQEYGQQTLHTVDASQVQTYSQEDGYTYDKPAVKFVEEPKTVSQYSTPSPIVSSTYRPQTYSHQTIHKVESQNYVPVSSTPAPKVELSYQQAVSTYENPILKYTQKVTPVTYVQPTATVYTQTYKPVIQQHEVKHIVSQPVQYEQQQVHISQEGYSYSQPEIQRNIESKGYSDASAVSHQVYHQSNVNNYNSGKNVVHVTTSPATLIYENHYVDVESPKVETYQAPEYIPPKNNYKSYSVSTASAPVVHQTQEYLAPKVEYQSYSIGSTASTPIVQQNSVVHTDPQYDSSTTGYKSYSVSSTASAPVVHQSSVVHKTQEYLPPQTYSVSTASTPINEQSAVFYQSQDNYDYSQQYENIHHSVPAVHQHSFSTSHVEQPQKVESIHISFPSSTVSPAYQQVEYQAPEIQVVSKGEEYLPPVVSTSAPVVTSTFRPRTYSTVYTTREYLPPAEPKYEYLPPSTTARPIIKSTTPAYRAESTTAYKASEYLPPVENNESKLINFESFGFNEANADSKIQYNPYQEITVTHNAAPVERKHNIVVETAKSHLLGFGTVGPDAGLVSPVTYTTSSPVVSSTYRQRVKSTARPAYKYSTTTEYQAPEYLPPSDDLESNVNYESFKYNEQESGIKFNPYQEVTVSSTSAPVQRKQNIVIQTAKSQQLGFGTVGPDAGLVSPVSYTTSAPIVVSSTESYSQSPKTVTSTYAPVEQQGLFEVVPSTVPARRTKPKVAVVTKINDFNPFLVRKLGAVCSCQSPVLILKGKRPTQAPQDLGDYKDYESGQRGDIGEEGYGDRYSKLQSQVDSVATAAPIVSSTFNPIIVPDDSFYQDYQEQSGYDVAVTSKPKAVYSESYVSSTPAVVSSTEKYIRVRPRVKAVTVAPTYKTVLLNQEATQTVNAKDKSGSGSAIDSQAFDRYGPGGWRSRDETLQGSVDCQRAGLFRHPKQCNKFYACRWDCTKQRFTLHVFNCPVQLSFDPSIGACNWPSQGPACQGDTLLTNVL